MKPLANFTVAALATAGLTSAQTSSQQMLSERYGKSCGPQLLTEAALPGHVGLRVDGVAPRAQLLLLLGSRKADQALPGSSCHLLTMPQIALPLVADSRGSATATLALPSTPDGLFRAQAIEIADRLTPKASAGLALVPTQTAPQVQILAVVKAGQAEYEFVQTAPDEVLVVASGRGTPPAHLSEKFDPVALYRKLTGKEAPLTLQTVQEAARKAEMQTAHIAPPEGKTSRGNKGGGSVGPQACFSSNWFVSNFCQNNSGWVFCTVNNYSNPWAEDWCSNMLGATACNSGTYLFQYRRRTNWVWTTPYSKEVKACHWYWKGVSGGWARRRMQVLLGSGDAKHLSVKGN